MVCGNKNDEEKRRKKEVLEHPASLCLFSLTGSLGFSSALAKYSHLYAGERSGACQSIMPLIRIS